MCGWRSTTFCPKTTLGPHDPRRPFRHGTDHARPEVVAAFGFGKTHRLLASILVLTVAAFAVVAWRVRAEPRVGGRGGVLRAVLLALAAVALRLSVLLTLREAWNVRALVPEDLRVIDRGPYRYVRHPNYVALALEFLGLPLMGGAYLSAIGLSIVNALLLRERIREEEALLMAIPAYRERMGEKPRFLPRMITGR